MRPNQRGLDQTRLPSMPRILAPDPEQDNGRKAARTAPL